MNAYSSIPSDMTDFIEQMGVYGIENGITRSVGRVMGYLLYCEPAQQSAEDIQKHLGLSAGATSIALQSLLGVGLVRRVGRQSERRLYYEIDSDGWKRTVLAKLQGVRHAIDLAESGMRAQPDNQRLQAMRDTYAAFDAEMAAIRVRLGW